jgi:transcriptional regulator with XRE-family HTH domain
MKNKMKNERRVKLMYKYLPTENNVALKTSLNKVISENNISSNKISKAIGVDTSHLKVLRDPSNVKMEISPDQYVNLVKYLSPKKVKLDLGTEPEEFFDKFMFYLFRKGITFDEFCSIARKSKTEIKNMFTKNGVPSRYKDIFIPLINDEEFNNLNSYNSIILDGGRDSKIIRCINDSTLINVFMIKRGLTLKDLAVKSGYNDQQVQSILEGFIIDSNLTKMSEALQLPLSTIDKVILNSWDSENNFGYFLQKIILKRKYNVYSMSELIDIPYCDFKGIVSGSRNIREDEFDKIALGLNLDPDELRIKAPSIIEGDDEYIPWNFVKWTDVHPEVTFSELTKVLGKDANKLVERIRTGKKYKLPEITLLMSATGLTKDQLRSKLSEEEIEAIKSTRRKSGRKYNGDPNSFDMFIRNHIDEKGLSLSEFSELVGSERTTLAHWMKDNKVREDILENILLVLDLTKEDIKKFKVKTFKGKITQKKVNVPKVTEEPKKEEEKENLDLLAKYLAKSIFLKIENGAKFSINYSNDEYSKLIDNAELREKVISNMNILLIDNMMGDSEVICEKRFNQGAKETYLLFWIKRPEPDFNTTETIIHKDESSLIPNMMIEMDLTVDKNHEMTPIDWLQQPSSSDGVKPVFKEPDNTVTTDDKDFMMEELDKFLELYSTLKESDQCTILRMINLVKHPDDLKMENIPEECFLLGKFAEYKKIDTLVKLIGLDK